MGPSEKMHMRTPWENYSEFQDGGGRILNPMQGPSEPGAHGDHTVCMLMKMADDVVKKNSSSHSDRSPNLGTSVVRN